MQVQAAPKFLKNTAISAIFFEVFLNGQFEIQRKTETNPGEES